jgi:hypothetical protein
MSVSSKIFLFVIVLLLLLFLTYTDLMPAGTQTALLSQGLRLDGTVIRPFEPDGKPGSHNGRLGTETGTAVSSSGDGVRLRSE